jgi:hypothetical protein
MMLLAIDFTSMTWTGKSRLVKEGYALSEINKYSLKQLGSLHAIETDEKKKNAAPKLESKKGLKPDIGGTLNESSAAGLVRMFQEGAKFERMIKSNLLTKQQL